MPTAIIKAYTPHGFIVAADGRSRSGSTGQQQTDDAQKIFSLHGPERNLCWAISGMADIFNADTGEVVLNTISIMRESIAQLGEIQSRHNLNWYASKLAKPIFEALSDARNNNNCGSFPDTPRIPCSICQIYLYGYYRKSPAQALIRFRHDNQLPLKADVFSPDPSTNPVEPYGSDRVGELLFNTLDERLNEFRTSAIIERMQNEKRFENLTLDEAHDICKAFIHSCDSEQGHSIDGEMCAGIGGHIHIAEITPDRFRWRIPPKAKATQIIAESPEG